MSSALTSGRSVGMPSGIIRAQSAATRSTARVPRPKTRRASPSSGRTRGFRRYSFSEKPTPAQAGRK